MAEQVKQIGEEILANARVKDGDTISLVGDSIPDSWMVVNTFGETFRTHRCHVYRLSDSSIVPQYIVEFHLIGFDVRYENIFHSGLFGQKFLTRSVTTQLSYHVLGGLKKEIVAGNIVHKTSVDTVAIDAIPELENRTIKSTLGVLPSDPFLDKAIEPFIIIGAAGIAIYLLFHIRSS
jgi:hypothetical protein